MRIAVDLLGGDDAPAVVVDGALQACGADPDLTLLLVGPRPAADEVIARLDAADAGRVHVLAVERGGRAWPTRRARRRPAAPRSARPCSRCLPAGRRRGRLGRRQRRHGRRRGHGAWAGPTGVRRPALAAILPGVNGPLVLLDVGAGMQVSPVDLVQHAALGAGYARLAAGVRATPGRAALGRLRAGQGRPAAPGRRRGAAAAPAGRGASTSGPVEGDDVVTGARADVVVTDGFTGNVLLKGVEAALAAAPGSFPPDGGAAGRRPARASPARSSSATAPPTARTSPPAWRSRPILSGAACVAALSAPRPDAGSRFAVAAGDAAVRAARTWSRRSSRRVAKPVEPAPDVTGHRPVWTAGP